MTTIAEKVFNFIIEDKEVHQSIIKELPPDKRKAVVGRKGRIIVSGDEGGIFDITLTPYGLYRDDEEEEVRNEVLMSDDTLIEILIYLARDEKDRGIDPRSAYANRLIRISGSQVLYDAEEIFSAIEKHAFLRMQPIAKAVLAGVRGK